MTNSLPVVALTVLGTVITALGVFAAGSFRFTALGLAALVAAGMLELTDRRRSDRHDNGTEIHEESVL